MIGNKEQQVNKDNEIKLMNIEEAASYLGIKKSRLYTATRRRELPFIKVGRLVRFEREHLDRWIGEKHKSGGHCGNIV